MNDEHAEVKKCAKCGMRVNWAWWQNCTSWPRRCPDAACQSEDGWLDAPTDAQLKAGA